MIGLCGCWARPSVFDGGECGSAGGSGPLQLTHNARHHLHPGCLGFLFLLYWPDFFPSSSRCAGRLSVEDVGAACEGGDRMGDRRDPGPRGTSRGGCRWRWIRSRSSLGCRRDGHGRGQARRPRGTVILSLLPVASARIVSGGGARGRWVSSRAGKQCLG